MALYSNSEKLLQHLQNWADGWESEKESDQKAWTITAIDYFMQLVKVTATTEIPSYSEIRSEAFDDFIQEAEEWSDSVKALRNDGIFFTLDNLRQIAEQLKKNSI